MPEAISNLFTIRRGQEFKACEKCQHLVCVCAILKEHDKECPYRIAAVGPVPVHCEHHYDVCPICDPCTCHPIPPITDKLGRSWNQPDRELILVDEKHAIMAVATLAALPNYSTTNPSGVYPGKMWRRAKDWKDESKGWILCWYSYESADFCKNNYRDILLLT